MSSIQNLEPKAFGLVTFKTTFGTVDIELFTKQCPKATRNFVQLCLDGYYKGTVFERVEKDFIAVGGVQKAPLSGDFDETFPDEFHSRLRFSRRGLIATANLGKNENGPKFFFTLGPAPELQNKHTIFGRVVGNSVYSLTDLNECQVDEDCCPYSEQKITDVIISDNPFPELVPRLDVLERYKVVTNDEDESDSDDPLTRPKPDPRKLKKLSFHPDDEDEEEDSDSERSQLPNKTVVDIKNDEVKIETHKLESRSRLERSATRIPEELVEKKSDDELEQQQDTTTDKERKMREIRAQIAKIKEQIENDIELKSRAKKKQEEPLAIDHQPSASSGDRIESRLASKKGRHRERETIELATKFKKKLKEAHTGRAGKSLTDVKKTNVELTDLEDLSALDQVDGDDWLQHKFIADDD